ncbi:MAG: hypothetical protein NC299_01310 [Lachnospiraceae bacterium]|nr:hypothetical protein [Ruminococcus sp.]MCM1273987.1 hypothetical protein [Lachnospiraceae bacterium]
MPRLILSERQRAGKNLTRNIRIRGAQLGCYTFKDIAKRTGIDKSTFSKNADHPEHWTLKSLFLIAQGLGVPIEWLFGEHTEVDKP